MPKYPFESIALNAKDKKIPVESDRDTYLGLEHLDPGTFVVSRFNTEAAPKGEKLLMKKGDVLFGKRRAYQRKVAIAPFDGIFSAHGMVLRPKRVIDPAFFPFFIRSDAFLDKAIDISVGSLSPTINWKDLKDLEFYLPSLERQKKLAKILWGIEEYVEKAKGLLYRCDDLIKSRFVEMFGASATNKALGEISTVARGGSPRPISDYITKEPNGLNWIKIGDITEGDIYIRKTEEKVIASAESKSRHVYPGDFILSNSMSFGKPHILQIDGLIHDGWLVISDYQDSFLPLFLFYVLSSESVQHQFAQMASGSTVNNLNSERVRKTIVPVPDKVSQSAFVNWAGHIDKLKFVNRINSRFLRNGMPCRRHRCL